LYGPNAQRVADDIYHLVSSFQSLIPKSDTYYNNEGIPETLICLTGTIPISFHGAKYNIPLMMWIPRAYPFHPPTCFVTPTKEMVIKQNHQSVDANGQCFVPYLQEWGTSSVLLGFVTSLCGVFSKEPPLFSVGAQQRQNSQSNLKSQKPLPPTPSTYTPSPAIPPSHTPPSYTPPPIHTPLPPTPSLYPNTTPTTSQISPPTTRTSTSIPSSQARNSPYQNDPLRQATQTLQRKLDEFMKQSTKDIDTFMANQNALQSRSVELDNIIQKMQQEENELEKVVAGAIAKGEEIEDWISRMEQPRDLDEIVVPEDPLSNQLFNVIAEDSALEDLVYYLGKALAAGKMDSEAYLKEVRSISRQQFFARALSLKLNSMVNHT